MGRLLGGTRDEACRHIEEVVGMVLESMVELGVAIPGEVGGGFLAE